MAVLRRDNVQWRSEFNPGELLLGRNGLAESRVYGFGELLLELLLDGDDEELL